MFLSQLALLLGSSNSKEVGSMLSLSKLQFLYIAWQGKLARLSLSKVLTLPPQHTADNRQPMFPAPTLHCTLPFCNELCSVELKLLDLVVFQKHGSERGQPEFDCDAE